ncbi:hypothetical protein DCAR_0418229 [Daucus carota subsp. sativus]|uniref:RING-type E3 ubiquitin transferase n=1 Tax=Daucus carota subsp. sativus TaxID=79200 RepID=A0A165Z921_DAUCS|nr:PREDICTED: RING-H2 finger protein ATL54-like [Daucus carota subsp. sativus]WOG98883.1 hypothetical protein DCAR_0418229 [Daucus carota subsp. sativus]
MALKHRKLFPSSSPNNTFDGCADICDPTIPYPDFDVLEPLLSPPPPQEFYFTSHKASQHVSPYVIIIITLLASLFLLIGYYVIFVKYCRGCRRFRSTTRRSLDGSADGGVEFVDEVHGPILDHPIWYITTVGLQASVIDSISIFKYKKCDNLIEGTDCSVCLTEFRDDEMLRLLPKCNHAFHIPCIDTWLRSHTTCPLCRAGIVPNNDANFCAALAQNDQNSSISGRIEELNSENVAAGSEATRFNQVRNEIIRNREVVDEVGSANSSNNVKRLKRSFSVDLNSIGDTLVMSSDERSSSAAETLAVKMKRSVSCSGKFFLSRHFRSQSAVLPL